MRIQFDQEPSKSTSTIEEICTINHVIEDDAMRVIAIWNAEDLSDLSEIEGLLFRDYEREVYRVASLRSVKEWMIDKIIDTHGIEQLVAIDEGMHDASYCNAGDPYASTIIFYGEELIVGTSGDWVDNGRFQ